MNIIEDLCYPNPCQHDGVCILCDDPECEAQIECECQNGWYGETCNIRKKNEIYIRIIVFEIRG